MKTEMTATLHNANKFKSKVRGKGDEVMLQAAIFEDQNWNELNELGGDKASCDKKKALAK